MYSSSLIENFEPNNKSIINIIKLKLNLNIVYSHKYKRILLYNNKKNLVYK